MKEMCLRQTAAVANAASPTANAPAGIGRKTSEDVADDDARLIDLYRSRLGLSLGVSLPPTLETLRLLTESHLSRIPFENVSMHTPQRRWRRRRWRERNAPPAEEEEDERKVERRAGDCVDSMKCSTAWAGVDDVKSGDREGFEPPVVLAIPGLINKILLRRRGGCCLELNGLYAHLLRSLGYSPVRLVPCWVYAGRERGHSGGRAKFRAVQTHFWILVGADEAVDSDDEERRRTYLVDVGLGEPPLGPLEYGPDNLGDEQVTPDGMRSRIVRESRVWTDGQGRVRRCLRLEWLRRRRRREHPRSGNGTDGVDDDNDDDAGAEHESYWEPRLQWDVADAPLEPTAGSCNMTDCDGDDDDKDRSEGCGGGGPPLLSFHHAASIITSDKSTFAKKVIACRLTRDAKVTLSGRTVRVTSPRFPWCDPCPQDGEWFDHGDGEKNGDAKRRTVAELRTTEDIRSALDKTFGIPRNETEGLDMTASDAGAGSRLWEHL